MGLGVIFTYFGYPNIAQDSTDCQGIITEAYRIGEVQQVAPTPEKALEAGIQMANKVAGCAPLGIKTTLLSAHLAIDPAEEAALSKLDAQFGALFHTQDFLEGVKAEAEGRKPVYQGK
ncbi:MAG: hypothetical protein WB555_24855 [Candidatus Korobacteraceae bacterium]